MREIRTYGSARGVPGNRHSYRNYAIFSHQVFVSEQEFLIDRARDLGQQRFPIHVVLPPLFRLIDLDYRSWRGLG